MKGTADEEMLELAISYILIVGVVVSIVIEMVGMLSYYYANRDLSVAFRPEFALQGHDFFTYSESTFRVVRVSSWSPLQILSLGLVLLMLTPYIRVVASVIYFGWVKNVKYLSITLFVLIILTASLLLH
jgi:uncharacterized membrane protein